MTAENLKSYNEPVRHGLRSRLMLGFFSVIFVFLLSTGFTLLLIQRVNNDIYLFQNYSARLYHSIEDLQLVINNTALQFQQLIVARDETQGTRLSSNLDQIDSLLTKISGLAASTDYQEVISKWTDFQTVAKQYRMKIDDIYKLYHSGDKDKAFQLYKDELLPIASKLNNSFNQIASSENEGDGLLDVVNKVMSTEIQDIKQLIEWMMAVVIISLLLSMLISYLISNYTSRSILIPIKNAISIAQRVASGERNIEISTNRKDETGQLIQALSIMHDEIRKGEDLKRKYAEDIMHVCNTLVSTLDEVRHAVDAQSSGASEQASSINEITASIAEIEKSATQTMNKAKDLGSVAAKTRESGQLGFESVEASVIGMKAVRDKVQMIAQTILDLSRQTQQVGEITSVVNNLAQQSKMLALNASIEAAKAGDAGKGFTVVATEVKNLAEQSEQSTIQVQKILEDIRIATEKAVMVTEEGTKGVDNGLDLIEKTGDIIRDLNEVIRDAAIASQQIEAAVRQEGAGIEQINAGMNEINIVTGSFVESVGQTTEAMNNLAQVSVKLKDSVERYKE